MGKVRIPYYSVIAGRGYWQPNARMRAVGFRNVSCGPDGPAAWAIAERMTDRWQRARRGEEVPLEEGQTVEQAEAAKRYPRGSVGEAFQRYIRTKEWSDKALSTRTKIWWPAWLKRIAPIFADIDPRTLTLEDMSEWRRNIADETSTDAAHKAMKVWRALWSVMAALGYCERDADPSRGVRNRAPAPRRENWTEGEAVRLAKAAWRRGYRGLACIVAVAWDTQFSPVDVRTLRRHHLKPGARIWLDRTVEGRAKTGRAAIGTVSARTARLVHGYLEVLGVEMHADAFLFRNRSGQPYSEFTLADDFAAVRESVFAGDRRRLMDMRRSGTLEAIAGDASPAAVAAKMANSIDTSARLHKTYAPVERSAVDAADEARLKGRRRMRARDQAENESLKQQQKKSESAAKTGG